MTGLDYGEDIDGDGVSEWVDIYSVVTVSGVETVTVPVGTFQDCAKIETNINVTITLSGNNTKATGTLINTVWFAPEVGPVKRKSVITTNNATETVSEELTGYIVNGHGNGIHIEITPHSPSIGIGGKVQFNAVAYDKLNSPFPELTFTWNSNNQSVATIDSNGLAIGITPGITNITASSADIISNSVILTVNDYRVISLVTNDIIYDPLSKKIYASIPSRAGAIGNSITVIDPETGSIGPSIFVGSEPNKLAISDNGQFLYVALDGAAAVRRFNISTQAAELQFSLGSDSFFGPYYAEDIEVLPRNPNAIAIARKYKGVTPRAAGVSIYDDGIQRPNTTPGHFQGSNVIEFSATASKLYGFNGETTGFDFHRMTVDASGVSLIDDTSNLISGFEVDIRFEGGLIYATSGLVINPETLTIVGTFPAQGLVRPDSNSGRVFFLTENGTAFILHAFDQNTFLSLGSLDIQGVSGTPSSLIRWGTTGLAFHTSSDQVFIIRTTLIP